MHFVVRAAGDEARDKSAPPMIPAESLPDFANQSFHCRSRLRFSPFTGATLSFVGMTAPKCGAAARGITGSVSRHRRRHGISRTRSKISPLRSTALRNLPHVQNGLWVNRLVHDLLSGLGRGLDLANVMLGLVSYNFRVQEYSAVCPRTGAIFPGSAVASCQARPRDR